MLGIMNKTVNEVRHWTHKMSLRFGILVSEGILLVILLEVLFYLLFVCFVCLLVFKLDSYVAQACLKFSLYLRVALD